MTRVLRDGRVYRGDMGASARKAHRTRRQSELDAGLSISKRTFGIEIEYHSEYPVTKGFVAERLEAVLGEHVHVTGYHGDTCLRCGRQVRYDKWKIERDGSLGGRGTGLDSTTGEVVSPVLTGQKGIDLVKLVMKTLKSAGATITPKCGLHVHVGVRDLDRDGLLRLCQSYKAHERQIFRLVPRGRRDSIYCKPWMRKYSDGDSDRMIQMIASDPSTSGRWNKYTGLNLNPLARIGTVEFRMHGGTLNGAKAEAWVQFLLGFVDAMTDRPQETTPLTLGPDQQLWEFLEIEKYLPKKAKERLEARVLALN